MIMKLECKSLMRFKPSILYLTIISHWRSTCPKSLTISLAISEYEGGQYYRPSPWYFSNNFNYTSNCLKWYLAIVKALTILFLSLNISISSWIISRSISISLSFEFNAFTRLSTSFVVSYIYSYTNLDFFSLIERSKPILWWFWLLMWNI